MSRVRSVFGAIVGVGAVAVVLACSAPAAVAATGEGSVWWGLVSGSRPSVLEPGGEGEIVVTAQDRGNANLSYGAGQQLTIEDTLPAGVEALSVSGKAGPNNSGRSPVECPAGKPVAGKPIVCVMKPLTASAALHAFELVEVVIKVHVQANAAETVQDNVVGVSGDGAPSATLPAQEQPLRVGGPLPAFGMEGYEIAPEEVGGGFDTRAGSHPFQLTTSFTLDQTFGESGLIGPTSPPKDLRFRLPAGFFGNPTPFAQCSDEKFGKEAVVNGQKVPNECPPETAVGVATVTVDEPASLGGIDTSTVPVFNLVPNEGEPARFGFRFVGLSPVYLDTSVATGGDYAVTVDVNNITQLAGLMSSKVTFWGTPDAAAHNGQRGWGCLTGAGACELGETLSPPPLLTMPTSCEQPFTSTVTGDSWPAPEKPSLPLPEVSYTMPVHALTGCNQLPFEPKIEVSPDVPDAATATGLEVKVHVPQTAALDDEEVAEGEVRDTTVALPAGVTLNPGGAGGLAACDESLIGFLNASGPWGEQLFTETLPEPTEAGVNFCPKEAKVGTVSIQTPLLPNPLEGAVYLASPAPNEELGQNPFNTLVAMYIVARDPVSGTLVKLPGKVVPCRAVGETVAGVYCQAPGQLVSTFENTPQLPFENLILHFFGGTRAPLATPSLCGAYTTQASFTPWSAEPGSGPTSASSTFDITSGPNGSPCPSDPRPFSPEFQAGTTNIQAGGFSELLTTMGHPDVDQPLGAIQIKMPPGLSGLLSSVKLCEEPQATQGTCGPESLIGHTIVTAGLGSTPVVVKRPGDVYITGPYHGAPFGLSIVNPAEAGPFNLGNVIVRAKIEVNPQTAALTVTSDQLPTMLKGIPLDLQHVQVAIDRPGFTFNPTSCEPLKIEGTMFSSEGASAPVSTPLHVANCASLKFEPHVEATVSGNVTKQNGTSFTVKITKPAVQGVQADLRKFKIELPVQLPSRLTTLQKACTAAQFEANPAGCPAESNIGHMRALTPLLPVPIEGPMYFVSHGGEAFPSLEIVLQGYGVTVDLVGTTFISKAGITSSTFSTLPDVPFTFAEAALHNGPYSALTGLGDLCAPTKTVTVKKKVKVKTKHGGHKTVTRKVKKTEPTSLTMPTELVAQSGGNPIKVNTTVHVTECPKSVVKAHKKIKTKKAKKRKK